jgi:hypothetical protein
MKKIKTIIWFIILPLIITSCYPSVNLTRKRIVDYNIYDFRTYSEKNFFISPYEYNGEFKPIGLIYISVYPSISEVEETTDNNTSDTYGSTGANIKLVTEKISTDEMLKIMYDKAKELGADGLVSFKMSAIYKTRVTKYSTYEYFSNYDIQGFAIKRK